MAWLGPLSDQIRRLTLLVLVLGVTAGCEMIRPGTERPHPKDQVFAKSFFFQDDGKTSKTFLCGSASINENGQIAKMAYLHNHNSEFACNVQFKVTETHLIGRQIDPSYPNAAEEEWEDYIVIPIKSHFYLERKKDSRGRKTNEIVRNSDRSHWSARPYFELDLNKISFGDAAGRGLGAIFAALFQSNQYVQDIEVDTNRGFFGFSVVKSGRVSGMSTQAVIRYNLLEMQREPGFQVTPWVSENEVFLNPIFNVGARVQGLTNVFSLGKWRLREDRPIQLVLNGWPAHLEDIAYDAIHEWNETLTKVMKPEYQGEPIPYFQIIDEKPRFQFDLRYSALNYIADPEISAYAPLGIAMVNPDVVTGEILWGAANIYGGLLENLVNSYSSSKAANAMAGAVPPNMAYYDPTTNIDLDSGLKRLAQLQSPRVLSNVNPFVSQVLLDPSSWAMGAIPSEAPVETTNPLDPTGQLTESFRSRVLADLNAADSWMARQSDLSAVTSKRDLLGLGSLHSVEELEINYPGFSRLPDQQKWSLLYKIASQEAAQMSWGGSVTSDLESVANVLNGGAKTIQASDFTFEETLRRNHSQLRTVFDAERNVMSYIAGNTTILDYKPREEALRVLIKEVISHEFGHFLGLGHNFKENILPDPSKTDPEVYQDLVSKIDVERGLFANSTTIMGYPDMRTVMQWSYEDAAPGPHDEQALAFIYANKYPVWDASAKTVKYSSVPEGGLIPRENAFLPQCDDFTASYGIDPLCQRWDRGHEAESIVRNYFKDLDESLFHSLVAFTDTMGGNGWARQNSLWYKAFTILGRVRLFYDHMRIEYRSVFEKALEGRQAEKVLFEFAEACRDEKFSDVWTPIFAEHPGLKKLCVVNYIALDEMQKLLSTEGPDFTKYDVRESYVTYSFNGVAYDYSRVNGRMTRLTALPVKYASLLSATSSVPYTLYGPYLLPRFLLNNSEARFAYHTLYPLKITQMMASNVEANLKFENTGDNVKTVIGRSVLAMSSLLRASRLSNDSLWVSDDYLDKLYSHTRFSNINYVAILMRKSPREDDKFRVTHFDSQLYNFSTGARQELNQDVYLLDDLNVIVRSPQRMLLMPITKFRWLDNNQGYVVAISTEYEDDINNQLLAHSVAGKLTSLVKDQFTSCVQGPAGQDNGLAFFFNSAVEKSVFPGFEVYDGIATNEEHQNTFKISVRDNFERYWNWAGETGGNATPDPKTCEDAARGMAVGFITAEAINGYWLARILDYIEKE